MYKIKTVQKFWFEGLKFPFARSYGPEPKVLCSIRMDQWRQQEITYTNHTDDFFEID